MGKQILSDVLIHVNGIDISALCNTISLESVSDEIDVSTYGAEYRRHILGIDQTEIELELLLGVDGAATVTGTDVTTAILTGDSAYWNGILFDALHAAGDATVIDVAPHSSAPAVTNPWSTVTCRLVKWQPLAGEIGGPATGSLRFVATGPVLVDDAALYPALDLYPSSTLFPAI